MFTKLFGKGKMMVL